MAEANPDDILSYFVNVSHADPAIAQDLLDACNWDVRAALQAWQLMSGGDGVGQTSEKTAANITEPGGVDPYAQTDDPPTDGNVHRTEGQTSATEVESEQAASALPPAENVKGERSPTGLSDEAEQAQKVCFPIGGGTSAEANSEPSPAARAEHDHVDVDVSVKQELTQVIAMSESGEHSSLGGGYYVDARRAQECATNSPAGPEVGVHVDVSSSAEDLASTIRAKRLARFQATAGTPKASVEKEGKVPLAGAATSACGKSEERPANPIHTTVNPMSDAQRTVSVSTSSTRRSQPFAAGQPKGSGAQSQPLLEQKTRGLTSGQRTGGLLVTSEEGPGAAVKLLSHLLGMTLNVTDLSGQGLRVPSRDKLNISKAELPSSPDDAPLKVQHILTRRASVEADPLGFCVKCYCRAEPYKTNQELFLAILATVKRLCVGTILEQLVIGCHVLQTQNEHQSMAEVVQKNFLEFIPRLVAAAADDFNVSRCLLDELMKLTADAPAVQDAFVQLIEVVGTWLKKLNSIETLVVYERSHFAAVELLLSQPPILLGFIRRLVKEQKECGMGSFFERRSVLGSWLSLTTITTPFEPNADLLECFRQLPHFPFPPDDPIETLQNQIRLGMNLARKIVHFAFMKILHLPEMKESILAWLATLLSMNLQRTAAQFQSETFDMLLFSAADGFMINVSGVMLKLSEPFFLSSSKTRLTKISPTYPVDALCRLDLHNEPCLAGGRVLSDHRLALGYDRFRAPAAEQGKIGFVTECFFLTQYALHVGLMPAVKRFSEHLNIIANILDDDDRTEAEKLNGRKYACVFYESWRSCLQDPDFTRLCSEFYITQAAWLNLLLDKCVKDGEEDGSSEADVKAKQQKVFSTVLEFAVKDMALWFRYVVQSCPQTLQGLEVTTLVDCCVILLQRSDLLPGPLAQTRIVELLLLFVETSASSQRFIKVGWGSDIRSQLAAIVHTCPTVREALGPALLDTFAAVDVVEGLDVDKEDFDKFSARRHVQMLLEHLWKRHDCRQSVLNCVHTMRFQKFLNAVMDTLLYLLNDSMRRVANIHQVLLTKSDESKWGALKLSEREEKTQFLSNEQNVGRSFMRLANNSLKLLDLITEVEEIAELFTKDHLCTRMAAAMTEFLSSLCGDQSALLEANLLKEFEIGPFQLLVGMVNLAVRFSSHGSQARHSPFPGATQNLQHVNGFVKALSDHPDCSPAMMEKAAVILRKQGRTRDAALVGWKRLQLMVASLCGEGETNTPMSDQSQLRLTADSLSSREISLRMPINRSNMILESDSAVSSGQLDSESVTPVGDDDQRPSVKSVRESDQPSFVMSVTEGGQPPPFDTSSRETHLDDDQQEPVSDEVAATEEDQETAAKSPNLQDDPDSTREYIEALQDERLDTSEGLVDVHSYLAKISEQPIKTGSAKIRALLKESKQLSECLPVHPNGSIFVRQDEDRMDVVRALIIGPVDTPYSLGCFAFDIYCPPAYPDDPPLVKIVTTAGGTVRFNPNLYADGKVCLSLLGTWHGGDASEKWDPRTSSIYQVLVSIQGMILIPDPLFNEPGYEKIRGTQEGNTRSSQYNAGIRLYTVRHAMTGQLQNPVFGFEDIIKTHFRLQKKNIRQQMAQWLQECNSSEEEKKLQRAVDNVLVELDHLSNR